MSPGALLILGLGNVLLSDEGVGVHVVRGLEHGGFDIGTGVTLCDGGTLGLALLPLVADAAALILVDAADLGQPPGAVGVFKGNELQARLAGHVSPHQAGVGDLITVAQLTGALPRRVALVGVQPASLEPGLSLSEPVQASVPAAIEAVRRLAREMAMEAEHA